MKYTRGIYEIQGESMKYKGNILNTRGNLWNTREIHEIQEKYIKYKGNLWNTRKIHETQGKSMKYKRNLRHTREIYEIQGKSYEIQAKCMKSKGNLWHTMGNLWNGDSETSIYYRPKSVTLPEKHGWYNPHHNCCAAAAIDLCITLISMSTMLPNIVTTEAYLMYILCLSQIYQLL